MSSTTWLSYKGYFSSGLIITLGETIKALDAPVMIKTHLYRSFIELSDNILKYSQQKQHDEDTPFGFGECILTETADSFILTTSNPIDEIDLKKVTKRFNEIDNLPAIALKKLRSDYRIASDVKKGGNIGLITVALLCDKNLEISSDNNYLTLKIRIKKNHGQHYH